MNMLTTSIKLIRGQIRSIATILCIATLFSLAFTLHAHAQQQEISIPADRIEVLQTFPISKSGKLFPREERMRMGDSTQLFRTAEGFDPVAVYANSNPSSFIGYIIFNGSQVNGITRLIADNLSLVGTPPYKIGYVFFVLCNGNPGPVSVRPKIRYYLDNSGSPGTYITGFNFIPINVPNGSCQSLSAKLTVASQFTITSNAMWAAMSFDNAGGATATNEQMNLIGMAFYDPPDLGSSNNNFYLSTGTPGEFTANNPAGSLQTFNSTGGPPDPPDNFGWELRKRVKFAPFARLGTVSQPPSSTVAWTVTLDTSDPADGTQLTGLTPANFALGTSGGASGSITSVLPNGGNNSWTVSANVGAGNGTVTLNIVNDIGLNTALGHTFPISGAPYTIGGGSGGAPGVVISQVYGGGGGASGTYLFDYVELKNASTSPKSLSGMSLYYGSATGQFASSASNAFALPNVTIPPGGHYLVQTSTTGTGGVALPVTPDATTTNLSMSGTSGKIALVAGLPTNTCGASGTPCVLPHFQIVDLVAWGAASNAEGGAPTNGGVAITATQGNVRKGGGCVDTNNNNADFDIVTAPVPRNSTSPASACSILTNTRTPNDYDGDGRTDYVVLRDSNGATAGGFIDWYISMNSNAAMHQVTWGIYDPNTEDLAAADYDGDGKVDIAVWRRSSPYGTFHIILSSNFTLVSDQLGFPTDDPVPGDYNGDGKADVAVLRDEGNGMTGWYYRPGFGADYQAIALAGSGAEAGGDYDGDGIYDPAVFDEGGSPAQFRILLSGGGGLSTRALGEVNDLVVPGDYDGDGKTDPAVARNVSGFWQWTYRPSSGGSDVTDSWGIAPTDMPVPGDYNGDGKWDYAVWRPGTQGEFFVMTPVTRLIFTRPWGLNGDFPLGYGTNVSND
jgi:hypothetical protein